VRITVEASGKAEPWLESINLVVGVGSERKSRGEGRMTPEFRSDLAHRAISFPNQLGSSFVNEAMIAVDPIH
jgi:hypothetical protein